MIGLGAVCPFKGKKQSKCPGLTKSRFELKTTLLHPNIPMIATDLQVNIFCVMQTTCGPIAHVMYDCPSGLGPFPIVEGIPRSREKAMCQTLPIVFCLRTTS
ncbi:unnamed protein product [Kuraishia capsulata CBS 1993]|uniref:Uncharacterized protein n=1 Tax=Kuraishia capsulata CBS 1993 TaxID=1382522 RepID=W6MMY8_9ASCO|nr:uncharacterized protein KUCA_T00002344001 [Kuraishia capsulata CBS 1993]CDK26372.1 unnamed protein product [Kuraishia capsulata CBS 1993]